MAKKKTQIPKYGTITLKGIQYYRTRITDADGKELSLMPQLVKNCMRSS